MTKEMHWIYIYWVNFNWIPLNLWKIIVKLFFLLLFKIVVLFFLKEICLDLFYTT